jgi:hypothetical protein
MIEINGKIIYEGLDVRVADTTYNASFADSEYKIVTTGSSTIVLPANDGTICKYHIYVKSGTCQIRGTVDGLTDPILQAQVLEYDIITDGAQFFTVQTEKDGYEVVNKSKTPTITSYNTSGVIAINTVVMTIDCGDNNSISISCLAMGTTGVITPRWRNATGETGQGATIVNPSGVSATTFNAVGIWTTPVFARYLDLVMTTATTAGTTTLNVNKLFAQTPVQIIPPAGTQTVSGAVTAAGAVAHSAAASGNPVYISGKSLPATLATIDTTLVAGDAVGLPVTSAQQVSVKDFGTAELDVTTNITTSATTTTVQPVMLSSGVANVRNYIAELILQSDVIGAAGNAWILDGALTVSSIAITTGLVTTSAAHDLKPGDQVIFNVLSAGTGVTVNTVYYVTSIGSGTTFNFSASMGGSNVVPSVAYTGTTMYRLLYQFRLQTAGMLTPTDISFRTPLRGNSNMNLNLLFPVSMISGNVYLTLNGFRNF